MQIKWISALIHHLVWMITAPMVEEAVTPHDTSYDPTTCAPHVTASYWVWAEGRGAHFAACISPCSAPSAGSAFFFQMTVQFSCEVSFHCSATGTGAVVWLQRSHLRMRKMLNLRRGLRQRTGHSSEKLKHQIFKINCRYVQHLIVFLQCMNVWISVCVCRYIINSYEAKIVHLY